MNEDSRRKRRRRRRIIASGLFLIFALSLAWFFESQATTTVLFLRNADVDNNYKGDNPGLSAAGEARAEEIARVLGDIDVVAGVDAIFATPYRVTQETVEPLSKKLNLPWQVIDAGNVRGLTDLILSEYKGRIVLVVTSREALPLLIAQFQGSKKVPPMDDAEHDNLYIVSIPWYGRVKTLRLKFGVPYFPEA